MSVKKAIVRQVSGITLAAKSDSNHWVMMDGRDASGGECAASSPKELLLMALGGCTSMDVIPILKKKGAKLDGFEVKLTGNAREEHPQVFTDIHIEYVFYGDSIAERDVQRAIELSTTKYCSVSAMLRESVKLTHSYTILQHSAQPVPDEASTSS
ncbi:MAG TPA: OsmC family protein [Bacteroidota bacterium]|nr:OsmC family protein [Bacteroidota bacterium]